MELYSGVFVDNLQKVRNDILPTFDAFIYEKEPFIRQLIKQRWLLGKKPDGSLIGRYKDFDYADAKNQVNPLAGFSNVDLIDSGDLVNAIEIFKTNGIFTIESTDFKFDKIAKKYGEENFNITQEETNQLLDGISAMTIIELYNKYISK